MKFTRFTINAGEIAARSERDAQTFDSEALRKATEVMTRVRSGEANVACPDLPFLTLEMRKQATYEEHQESRRELVTYLKENAASLPAHCSVEALPPTPSRAEWETTQGDFRPVVFCLKRVKTGGRGSLRAMLSRYLPVEKLPLFREEEKSTPNLCGLYYVLSETTPEQAQGGLYGAIGGSFIRAQFALPEKERSENVGLEHQERANQILKEIWDARPCVVCVEELDAAGEQGRAISAFTDCFAAAMLLNPEPSPG